MGLIANSSRTFNSSYIVIPTPMYVDMNMNHIQHKTTHQAEATGSSATVNILNITGQFKDVNKYK